MVVGKWVEFALTVCHCILHGLRRKRFPIPPFPGKETEFVRYADKIAKSWKVRR